MNLYIELDALTRALGRAQAIVERRSTHRILSSVLLEADEDGLRFTASDSEMTLTGMVPANVRAPGAVAVEAEHLYNVVRNLPATPVHLASDGRGLAVEAGSAWFELHVLPAEDYPALPEFHGDRRIRVAANDLAWLVERVAFSVCTDDNRFGINGAHLERHEDAEGKQLLRMVGTDGHRLAYAQIPFEGEFGMPAERLLPRKALSEIARLVQGERGSAGDGAPEVTLHFGDSGILLEMGRDRFYFRLLQGTFPEYRRVLPEHHEHVVRVDRTTLLGAVKRIGLVASAQVGRVEFAFGSDELVVSTVNADVGRARETVPIEMEGEGLEMGFNARYLQDALQHAETDVVRLELSQPLLPALVREEGFDRGLFVVMPMRLE